MWLWPSSCCNPSPLSVVRPDGAAHQEAARAQVAGRPDEIADALEPEHRVEDEERDHLLAVRRVRRRGGHPRRDRAGFVDAFLQNLARLVFAVPHQLIGVLRPVELAERRVHADLAEHAFHAEGARFIRNDRHQARADDLVANQRAERARVRHRRRELALAAVFEQRFERVELRHRQRRFDVAPARPGTVRRARLRVRAGTCIPGCSLRAGYTGSARSLCRRSESRSGRGTCAADLPPASSCCARRSCLRRPCPGRSP